MKIHIVRLKDSCWQYWVS